MAIKTYTQQLEEVQAAISEVLSMGQENRGVDAQALVRARLDALQRREQYLRPLAQKEALSASGRRGKRRIAYVVPTNG